MPTPNHGYNTPSRGTSDWDVPLNENFDTIDTDVEVRDSQANLTTYTPSDGAKYVATDTGNVWIGDGDAWNRLGAIGAGEIVASPGDVQSALDEAGSNYRGGMVKLDPSAEYIQPSTPWIVPSDCILDFNGADIVGHGNRNGADVIHLQPGAQVRNPHIDLWDNGNGYTGSNQYTGRVFTLNADMYGDYFADGTTIKGGYTTSVGGSGTWIYVKGAGDSDDPHVTCLTFETDLMRARGQYNENFGIGIHLDSIGTSGFLNSLRFKGNFRAPVNLLVQEGGQPNNSHVVEGTFQQEDGAELLWHLRENTWGRDSVMQGVFWDVNSGTYPDGTAVLFDSGFEASEGTSGHAGGNAINAHQGFPTDMVVNNHPTRDQYVNNMRTLDSTPV